MSEVLGSTYKVHLPSLDQSGRWVGAHLHEPPRTVVTACGQVHSVEFLRKHDPGRVVIEPAQSTCRRCRGAYDLPAIPDGRPPRLRLIQGGG